MAWRRYARLETRARLLAALSPYPEVRRQALILARGWEQLAHINVKIPEPPKTDDA